MEALASERILAKVLIREIDSQPVNVELATRKMVMANAVV
jgi:hypothetical protein